MRIAAGREQELCAAERGVQRPGVELDAAARHEANQRPLLLQLCTLDRSEPVARRLMAHRPR